MYAHRSISMLCVIYDMDSRHRVTKIFEQYGSFFALVANGKGTAGKRILSYLGLDESQKSILFKVLPTKLAVVLMEDLDRSLKLDRPGHGIAFRISIKQATFHHRIDCADYDEGGTEMETESAYNLLWIVFNRGYGEEVMQAAREAGATGGTMLHAYGFSASHMEKFLGITIAPEKEILMVLAADGVSTSIMDHIAEVVGMDTVHPLYHSHCLSMRSEG